MGRKEEKMVKKHIIHGASRHGKWVTLCGSYCKDGIPATDIFSEVNCKKCKSYIDKLYPKFIYS
jgi:hypothetical protein